MPPRTSYALGAWCALAAALALCVHVGTPNERRWALLAVVGLTWLLFAVAARCVLRLPRRQAVAGILVGGAVLQALALTAPPRMTDDFLRYAWDGRVQAAGVSPYRYPPDAPELADLRDPWLFPDASVCRALGRDPGCPRLNHPTDRTIYPPVAQAYFWTVHVLPGDGPRSLQAAAALLAIATSAVVVAVLRRARANPRLAVLWAWCPTVVLEAGNNAHVDVLSALLVAAGLGALAVRRAAGPSVRQAAVAGLLLGAAVAVKLLPALVGPAALRRRPVLVAAAGAAALVAVYAPHVLVVGPRVAGFLPDYLDEEGYSDGRGRFALITLLVPDAWAPVVAALLVGAAVLVSTRRHDAARPWDGAVLVTGTAFLALGPNYPWYSLLLVVLVALSGRWEWLAVAAAAYPAYFAGALEIPHVATTRWSYAAALAVVLVAGRLRRPPASRTAAPRTSTTPESMAAMTRWGQAR